LFYVWKYVHIEPRMIFDFKLKWFLPHKHHYRSMIILPVFLKSKQIFMGVANCRQVDVPFRFFLRFPVQTHNQRGGQRSILFELVSNVVGSLSISFTWYVQIKSFINLK
jgi:hypothetical protein